MSVKVDTVKVLKDYFSKVVIRAEHHAPNVNEIIYTLLGVIILKMDSGSLIEVRGTENDTTGNILWVWVNKKRYALRYEHANGGSIEIRENSYVGPIKVVVNNATPTSTILAAF